MIVYSLMPIDWWNGWREPSDLFRVNVHQNPERWHDPAEWDELWAKARELARRAGWEGDIREGPYVTVVPQDPGMSALPPVIIGWKQDNNGTTFVASPFPLPWLAKGCDDFAEG